MGRKLTEEELLQKVYQIHEEEFYSYLSPIEKTHSNILVQCQVCGNIWVTSFGSHVDNQRGCPKCSKIIEKFPRTDFSEELKILKEKFPQYENIEVFTKQVPDRNGVRNIVWVKANCKKHGIYEKRYKDCLNAKNICRKCSTEELGLKQMKIHSTEEFIEEARKIHGNNYDYSLVDFEHINKEITIICNKHKINFQQTPKIHLGGSGCQICGREKSISSQKLTNEEVVKRCIELRGNDFYDYSLVDWDNSKDGKIIVDCYIHGLFSVKFYDFCNGVDCKICAKEIGKIKMKETLRKKFGKSIITKAKDFLDCAKKLRPCFDYSKTKWIDRDKSIIVTFKGKDYKIIPRSFLNGKLPKGLIEKDGEVMKISDAINFSLVKEFPAGTNYRSEYIKLIINAKKNPPEGYSEKHHILPKSMFPKWINKESNLVNLSAVDHYRAHYLLYRIYDNEEMTQTFLMMYNQTNKIYDPEEYERARTRLKFLKADAVYCYELNKIFSSKKEAEKFIGIKGGSTLRKSVKDWNKTTGEYHWCLIEDKDKAIKFWKNNELKYGNKTSVYCYEQNKEYISASLAARENGLKSSIKKALNNWNKTEAGMHWCRTEDKIKAIKFWKNKIN